MNEVWPYMIVACEKFRVEGAIKTMLNIIAEEYMTGFVLNSLIKYKNPEILSIFKK